MAYMRRGHAPELLSGAQSMIGQSAPVIEEIGGTHRPGHVRIAGESWPAITADDSVIPAGSAIVVEGLRQATLMVRLETPPTATATPKPTKEGQCHARTDRALNRRPARPTHHLPRG